MFEFDEGPRFPGTLVAWLHRRIATKGAKDSRNRGVLGSLVKIERRRLSREAMVFDGRVRIWGRGGCMGVGVGNTTALSEVNPNEPVLVRLIAKQPLRELD